jgi:hypothetical protein
MTPLAEARPKPLTAGAYRPAIEAQARRVDESWGCLTWLVSPELTRTADLTLGHVVIKAGMAYPTGQRQFKAEP